MKKYFYIIAAASIIAASCSKQVFSEPSSDVTPKKESYKALTLNVEQCKTVLGDKMDNQYPVLWKAGDVISVNGVNSKPLAADVPEGESATFYVPDNVVSPFNVVYPASAVQAGGKVCIPVNQNYFAAQFDPAAAISCGYSESNFVSMNVACAFVRVTIVRSGSEVLKEVKLYSYNGEAMSGTYSLDGHTGKMSLDGDGRNYVALSSAGGLAYGSDGKANMIFSVPAGVYAHGFFVGVTTQDGQHMYKVYGAQSSCTLPASSILNMDEFTFSATSNVFSGGEGTAQKPYLIATVDDLMRLSTLSNASGDYAAMHFRQVADIDMAGVSGFKPLFPSSAYLTGSYDGNNRMIENLAINSANENAAFVAYLRASAGVIKNVNLVNCTVNSSANNAGGICGFLYQGKIENCSLKACSITGVSGVGGIAGRPYNATISGCTVDKDSQISASSNAGGIVGGGTTFATKIVFYIKDCTSYANVTSSGDCASGIIGGGVTMKGTSRIDISGCKSMGEIKAGRYAAGVVGRVYGANEDALSTSCVLKVDNCCSYCNCEATFGVGGIVANVYIGKATGNVFIINCGYFGEKLTATGVGGSPGYSAVGGIFGFNQFGNGSCKVINCVSRSFKAYVVSASTVCYGVGGILGYSSIQATTSQGPNEIRGCYSTFNNSDFYIDEAPALKITNNYGSIWGLMSSDASSGKTTADKCWYTPGTNQQAGPTNHPLATNTAATYSSLSVLLDNLNSFAASYDGCKQWVLGSDGYPVISGMNPSTKETTELGGSAEGWGESAPDGGNFENPEVKPDIVL